MFRPIVLLFLLAFSVAHGLNHAQNTSEDCSSLPALNAEIGQEGRVLMGVFLNVRPAPTRTQARIDELAGGDTFIIQSAPQCAEGFRWWQVELPDGQVAWVAESDPEENTYFWEVRGERVQVPQADGRTVEFIRTADGFLEPAECMTPPEDYERVDLGGIVLNQRTLFMLDYAQKLYDATGRTAVNFRQLLTQGSYNAGGVSASFGTHDGGGAVDIAVRDPETFAIMQDELLPMLGVLRRAGFAAWVRETGELYENSVIHIHAIAIGDAEASPIARDQVSGEFGYFLGFNGLPPADYGPDGLPIPDRYGSPIICGWMRPFLPTVPATATEESAG